MERWRVAGLSSPASQREPARSDSRAPPPRLLRRSASELRPEEVCAPLLSAIPTAAMTAARFRRTGRGLRHPGSRVALPDRWPPRAPGPDHAPHADRPRWRRTCDSITDMLVTSCRGSTERAGEHRPRAAEPSSPARPFRRVGLNSWSERRTAARTFSSEAVRAARNAERPATILVLAGQIIPGGYVSQYNPHRAGEDDQARGLDSSRSAIW